MNLWSEQPWLEKAAREIERKADEPINDETRVATRQLLAALTEDLAVSTFANRKPSGVLLVRSLAPVLPVLASELGWVVMSGDRVTPSQKFLRAARNRKWTIPFFMFRGRRVLMAQKSPPRRSPLEHLKINADPHSSWRDEPLIYKGLRNGSLTSGRHAALVHQRALLRDMLVRGSRARAALRLTRDVSGVLSRSERSLELEVNSLIRKLWRRNAQRQ